MKTPILICLIAFSIACSAQFDPRARFPFHESGKIGFLDKLGKIAIEPKFVSVGNFSEGLCAARINGLYGYIDTTGQFVIAPKFEFAEDFSEGIAVVYEHERPHYIDRQGNRIVDVSVKSLGRFEEGRAIIHTFRDRAGVIDKKGKLLVDTLFSRIESFYNDRAIVYGTLGAVYGDWDDSEPQAGVIDASGSFIIPFEQFSQITREEGDIFRAKRLDGRMEYLDSDGNSLFVWNQRQMPWFEGRFHSGRAVVSIMDYEGVSGMAGYKAVIDEKGQMVVDSPYYDMIYDFYDNRAFAIGLEDNYSIIDPNGRVISSEQYLAFAKPGFKNGKAFVYTGDGWGIIDTTAAWIMKPSFAEINSDVLDESYFYFTDRKAGGSGFALGVAEISGRIIIPPVAEALEEQGFVNGLLKAKVEGKVTYFNRAGEIVWKEKDAGSVAAMNIDYMNRAYCYASSMQDTLKSRVTSYRKSTNFPQRIDSKYPRKKLSLIVKNADKIASGSNYPTVTVTISNLTDSTAVFPARDSRLYMRMQAKDLKGAWRDIEYVPLSGGEATKHLVELPPDHMLTFVAPRYEGEIKTSLRFAVDCLIPSNPEPEKETSGDEDEDYYTDEPEDPILPVITLYSNEFDASVNPAQFWRRKKYVADGSPQFPYDYKD